MLFEGKDDELKPGQRSNQKEVIRATLEEGQLKALEVLLLGKRDLRKL